MTDVDSGQLVDLLAEMLQLPLDPAYRSGVIANFVRMQALAQFVIEFPLPDAIEVASVFEP